MMSSQKHVGAGFLAGAIAGLVMTVVMLVLASIFNLATPLAILGDRLSVLFTPERFFWIMGRVGGYNHMKQLGVGSAMFGQIMVGALGGAYYAWKAPLLSSSARRKFSLGVFILLPLIAATVALWPVLGTHYSGYPIPTATVLTLLGLLISFVAFERTLVLSYEGLTGRPHSVAENLAYSPPIARRALLLGGFGLLIAGGGAAILRKLYRVATFSYDGTQYFGETVQAITPNEQFYTVTKNVIDPVVDESIWRLEVTGLVDRPQRFDFDALKNLTSVTQETTLMCISNGLGAGLMSNAVWKGVTLRSLLEAAGPKSGVARVRLHGVDNYTDTIPLEKALDPA
ncbi:MAG: molybdopterin-dependent oxidoreductase, partial [Verrucomicrobiota bacterium]|nr:molybdopterin-dependent oxidoreductase [Verrucomicrobiota bacterium]